MIRGPLARGTATHDRRPIFIAFTITPSGRVNRESF